MSEQQGALTYEGILEMFRESGREFDRRMIELDRRMMEADRRMMETERLMKETDRRMKETDKKISRLGSRIGEIVESMVEGNIVEKFQALGYDVEGCSPNASFMNKKLGISGEIDLLLVGGDIDILIEVKTTLEEADVHKHIGRVEKYRRYIDAMGGKNKSHFIGAVAGAVVRKEVDETAHKNGLYVIVQSGEAVKIVPPPDGFTVKEW
jgi:hypothetical protein